MPRLTELVKLTDPLRHGDQEIHELTLTTPDMGGLMEIDEHTGDMAKTIASVAVCSGLPPSVIKQMLPWDMQRVGVALGRVMGESTPRRGGKQ